MTAAATITTKGQITIPAAVRKALGVGCGDRITFVRTAAGNRTISPVSQHALRLSQPASRVFNSPFSISLRRSRAPPTSMPLTNTIGKVGQPLHILSAVRRRQSPT